MKTLINLIRYDSFTIKFDSQLNDHDSKASNTVEFRALFTRSTVERFRAKNSSGKHFFNK